MFFRMVLAENFSKILMKRFFIIINTLITNVPVM